MASIEGMHDHEHAHLSPRMRQKLMDERAAGQKTVALSQEQQEYNQKLQTRLVEQDARQATLEAEALAKARRDARQQSADLAAEQQEINAKANLDKEIRDAHENLHGRTTVAHPGAAAMATDLVRQRTEQAKGAGLQPATGFIGHPEASEEQAAAAQANAEKEVQDRANSANYAAAGSYQGHTDDVVASDTDEWGNPIGQAEEGQERVEAYGGEGTTEAGEGLADHVDEPTATDLMGGVGEPEPPKRKRGRPPIDRRAVGDGPSSE